MEAAAGISRLGPVARGWLGDRVDGRVAPGAEGWASSGRGAAAGESTGPMKMP